MRHESVTLRGSITTQFYPSHPSDGRLKCEISKIQDGGGRHFENLKNCHISAAVSAILTKFGTVMQFNPLDRSDCYKF